ncbi:unnamed protein product [Polarella glacialis]|uniref:Uncharacterized protein n=1 Tax=Polarella glacialis TaxID=89957 RepID=A0A813LY40_POLGL|nr:unnamed protein product [Polarella glacialis]
MFNFGCSDCKPTDPATSTVKVDLKDLASGSEAERLEQEQVQIQLQAVAQQIKEKEASEALRQAERQAAARQAAKEAEEAVEAQRQAEEDERLRKHREAEQEAQRVRQAEEAGHIAEAAAAELEQESLERETAVATFLKLHGFTGVNSCKKSLLSSTYPLHKAAEAGDDKMVSLLCRAGANPTQKNSWGSTPAQVAKKSDKSGSHFKVLTVLATPDDAAPYAGQQSAGGA